MQVQRLPGGHVYFEYRFGVSYVRRTVDISSLTDFLTGGAAEASNLGPKGAAVSFEQFAETYLQVNARHRLKARSFTREQSSVDALKRFFEGRLLHKIALEDWETYKDLRLSGKLSARKPTCSEGTLIKEFKCLRAMLSYAVAMKYLRWNVLTDVKLGLVDGNRADIWLTKNEIDSLLEKTPEHMRALFEFRTWTGARPEEAALFGKENVNWITGQIWILTIKKRRKNPGALRRRFFKISTLGPRFEALLKRLVPHAQTGLYFANLGTGRPYAPRYVQEVFRSAVTAAGIVKRLPVVPYDLRGTFCMHRSMVVRNFGQLRTEMGHLDAKSVQHYLDEAAHHDPTESIFFGVDVSPGETR